MANALDPRLGAPTQQYGSAPPPLVNAARADSAKAEANLYGALRDPQPYYYPSPQTHTPQQSGGHSGAQSVQTSPAATYPQAHADSDAASPDHGDGQDGDDPKRPRACEACRGLKVRCDQDPAHPEIPCKRCAKAGRQCVITQPSRKRQKKADSRVAELEKKLDALTAALHQQQGAAQYEVPQHQASDGSEIMQVRSLVGNLPAPYSPHGAAGPMSSNKRKRVDETDETPDFDGADRIRQDVYSSRGSFGKQNDVSGSGSDLKRYLYHTTPEEFVNRINSLINPEMASTIFERYTTKLAPHLPAVVFAPGTTAEQVFKTKPILYVCILLAGAHGILHPDLSKQVAREAIGAIADCVVRNGAKSLELIQAMQVTALWYKPPEKAEQTNFYQIIHMAAVMALDIGLGKRFNPAKARRGFGGPNAQYAPGPHKTLPQDSDTLEARRAWLGCYYLCASASMVLRRPNLVRWTNYMKECIEVLESHPDAFPSDRILSQHVKIQHICEDIGLQFLMDDSTAQISITDPKVTYALNVLESQLRHWKEVIPSDCFTPGLKFFEQVTALYLHEIALHFNHNVEDFRMPFTEESLKSVNNTSDTLTQNQMAALEACLRAAHGILDNMLGFGLEVVKTLPMLIFFVRCVYALVILIKMHVAVCSPNSELGKMMKPEDLKVDHYVDSLINLFSYVTKEEEFIPHPKILRILNVLRDWFQKHKQGVEAQQRGEKPRSEHPKQRQQDAIGQSNQTSLHLLSQVATGTQQQDQSGLHGQEWTFDTPSLVDYNKKPPPGHPDPLFPIHQQQATVPASTSEGAQVGGRQQYSDAYAGTYDQAMMGVDPTNQDYGWGTGFEQAMDIALGGVDGLQQGGLDDWFLGDSMAPFGFTPGEYGGSGWAQ